ncbi:MAG: FG-GAP-like repeat-containing protein [Thermoanaerobaculia bacterium]
MSRRPFVVPVTSLNPLVPPSLRSARIPAVVFALLILAPAARAGCPDFAAAATYPAGTSPASVTVGDFNGDGRGDLAIANPQANNVAILAGGPGGTFGAPSTVATGTAPASVAAGDFNGDGLLDLAVANNTADTVSILQGNGSGGFTNTNTYGVHTAPRFVATGDFDRDGRLDLAVANSGSGDVSILLANGSGTFATAVNYTAGLEAAALAIGDFNGDGKADLAVANYAPNTVSILLGNGNGTFPAAVSYATAFNPWSVAIGDFNGDGSSDLAVANYGSNSVSILIGSGSGTFAAAVNYPAGTAPSGVSVGDFNRDGKTDLAVANSSSNNASILIGSGSGTFAAAHNYAAGTTPQAIATSDFDGDGKTDLAVPNAAGVAILLNDGACHANCATFGSATNFGSTFGGFDGKSVASADFDRDGKPDLAVVIGGSKVSVLLGNGSGSLGSPTDHAVGTNPVGVEVADFNRDGKPDLAVANESSDSVSILLGDGIGGFGSATSIAIPVTESGPQALVVGDFNRDGKPDVAVTCGVTQGVAILLNTTALGSGTPSFNSSAIASLASLQRGIATGDFDRDGKLDLAFAVYGDGTNAGSVMILQGDGSGSFLSIGSVATDVGPRAVEAGDFNRDGKLDLAVSNSVSNNVSILLGNGSGGFAAASNTSAGTSPSAITIADFDNDGKLDLAVGNVGTLSMLRGDGSGGFAAASPITQDAAQTLSSLAAVDLNLDGKLDLASANNGSSTNTSVVLNSCPPPDLTLSIQNVGGLNQGGSGGYWIFVTNALAIATTGRVTATATLPAGLTATGISGTNWDCTLATLTCRRSDSLAGNSGYESITLEVNVASNAPATVTVTSAVSGGSQANTANDTASVLTNVNQFADMTVTKTHTGNFTQGQVGASYTITVTNIGGVASSGPVTVTDTLPAGLTATAISGDGWVCTLGTRSCTRSNALASGSSYPAITLTVDVATTAASTVTNSVAVAGGSQNYTANDTATDPTTVVQVPDLAVTKSHAGNFKQRQTSRNYSIAVRNAGGAATSGTVTMVDTLPAGLTATAIRGNGWSCVLATLTCTRSDALAGGASHPVITVTVNVASDAPASVTNVATVSGGGQTNTANDVASDPTTIDPGVPYCGSFTPAVNYDPGVNSSLASIAVGDFNKDGKLDLATAGESWDYVSILIGSGTGTLTSSVGRAVGDAPRSVAAGDFNGDGNLDLVTANSGSGNASVLIGNGDATFVAAVNYAVGATPMSVVIEDFNGDGKLDLATANSESDNVSVLIGNGNGTFAAAVSYAVADRPMSLTVADFNADGKLDLAVANWGTNNVSILAGNGNGTFAAKVDHFIIQAPISVAVGDFNGDGKPDLAATSQLSNYVSILMGNGDGSFATAVLYSVGTTPRSVTIEDFNGDGNPDLAVASGDSHNVQVLFGSGSGTFATAVNYGAGQEPTFVTAGDFNGDGRPDLAVANFQSLNVSILLSACADLTIAKSHTGDFTQGQAGVSYTLTASNAGPVGTVGTVTVTDSLPTGLVATAIAGSGWACELATLTCTRSDALAASGSYPPITVTANVRSNAAATETNTATVSIGGEINTANNAASDPATVNPSGLIAPTRLVATTTSASQITVVWDAVTTAVNYQLYRSDHNGPFSPVGVPTANTYVSDSGLNGSTTYRYEVRAVNGANAIGPVSNSDFATTIVFTDDLVIGGSTVIKAVHMTELRTAVDAVRAAIGLANATYTNAISVGGLIRAADVTELRSNLNDARNLLGASVMVYTDPALTIGHQARTAHILNIRTGAKGRPTME